MTGVLEGLGNTTQGLSLLDYQVKPCRVVTKDCYKLMVVYWPI